ncbi:hypothetical protein OV208_18030 [Corallococcus sp. bb12-1]|uniref:hypothetical protein n=1 Tax=Corallococcus sp. bb12-1 TaxID=2996784 RepID=UPI0022700DB8|nr:hypothetical protein [Corallococcus sp. bb12-1]MCY1043221.1 hypothetical protein [Corallococcus sp. bb12-1]
MRGFRTGVVGLMAVVSLAGCGGPAEEMPETQLGETEQALACAHPDNSCPGTTTCVNGLCRDCNRQPQFCDQSFAWMISAATS